MSVAEPSRYPAALFLKVFSSVSQFCIIRLWSAYSPREFDFWKLRVFPRGALGGPIHGGYACLWIDLGLVTKSHQSLACCSIKTFCPLLHTPTNIPSFCVTHTHTHSITVLASLPPVSQGDLWGEVRQAASSPPRGATAPLVCLGSARRHKKKQPQWCRRIGTFKDFFEKMKTLGWSRSWSLRYLFAKPDAGRFFFPLLSLSCTHHWKLEREQLSHSGWCCFVMGDRVRSLYVSWRKFFGSSRSLALFVCLLFCGGGGALRKIPRLSPGPGALAFGAVEGEHAFIWNAVWQVCEGSR